MLKALELAGFKSFADKTRFEFHPGITVVVGPNGSGKSNVVDAIKWVLGEQSVKSLRGKEMADVIFNGSAGRPAMNSCEATLTFDNDRRLLAVDADEVHITRRVYRNGEGEYLINRQPSRLRDIRELFAGTGVATEAYSVIEQGKVDVLLQASPRDRRAIFEEAAGISRFKAKKIESLRRLERVEQNLLRLSDIVQEVESRFRSVRQQAAKARRYKEHTDRLQSLRTQVGLTDWRHFTERMEVLEREVAALENDLVTASAAVDSHERQATTLEGTLADQQSGVRAAEARAAEIRELIAVHESTVSQGHIRLRDAEAEMARHRGQLASMNHRAVDLQGQLYGTRAELVAAEEAHRSLEAQAVELQHATARSTEESQSARSETERLRLHYMDRMRQGAALGNQVSAADSQLDALRTTRLRRSVQAAELATQRETLTADLGQLRDELQRRLEAVESAQTTLQRVEQRLASHRQRRAAAVAEHQGNQTHFAALRERAGVLAELESRLEGLSTAAKELLVRARASTGGPLGRIHGLVADQFKVSLDLAAAIEAALGEQAAFLVVNADDEFLDYLLRADSRVAGRVGFVRDARQNSPKSAALDLEGEPSVVGRADRLVESAAVDAALATRLLGGTWVVNELQDALRLWQLHPEASYATLRGDLVEAAGAITIGAHRGAAGVISRRSELRALEQQLVELQQHVIESEQALATAESEIAAAELAARESQIELGATQSALAEHRTKVHAAQERVQQVESQSASVARDLAAGEAQISQAEARVSAARERMAEVERELAELDERITEHSARFEELEVARREGERLATAAQVEMATSLERLSHLRDRLQQFELDQNERRRALDDLQGQISAGSARTARIVAEILAAESALATLYLRKEALARDIARLLGEVEAQRQRRAELLAAAQDARLVLRQLEERNHKRRLALGELQLERGAVESRLRDDYGIELAQLNDTCSPQPSEERAAVEQEIAELRRKINSIGLVNLAALDDLAELENRHAQLAAQFKDLADAKGALEQIIDCINADSRRLFTETLEAVRTNFQALFRKLFGGGQADIVLEEGTDILESGIEIVARPPGTKPAYIAQLSGGQRALTCVALLMAIFQFRPSPFCVLDEVDAPLDESNIDRFVSVLKEFLAWTQFIVVTHSKKTMTCASTLYGVTMQESGVSKRVSVCFQDVSETGEILRAEAQDETAAA